MGERYQSDSNEISDGSSGRRSSMAPTRGLSSVQMPMAMGHRRVKVQIDEIVEPISILDSVSLHISYERSPVSSPAECTNETGWKKFLQGKKKRPQNCGHVCAAVKK